MTLAQKLAQQPAKVRWAAFAIVTLTSVIVIWGAIVWPLWHIVDAQVEWRSEASEALAHDRGWIQALSLIKEQARALPSVPLWTKFYNATSDSAVANAVQSDVSTLLNDVHATVQSLTPIPAKKHEHLSLSGVRVSATLSIDQLREFLEKLDSFSHYLHVERFNVTAPQTQVPDQNPPLGITVEVYGVRRPTESLPTPALPIEFPVTGAPDANGH